MLVLVRGKTKRGGGGGRVSDGGQVFFFFLFLLLLWAEKEKWGGGVGKEEALAREVERNGSVECISYPIEEGAITNRRVGKRRMPLRRRLQMIEHSPLTLKDGQADRDGRIRRVGAELSGDEAADASRDSRVDEAPLREGGLAVPGDGGDDGVLAAQGGAQGVDVGIGGKEVEFAHGDARRGPLEGGGGFGAAEDGDGEAGREEGADDVRSEGSAGLWRRRGGSVEEGG